MDALATLAAAGFDLAHAFDAAASGLAMLAGPERLGLLVGNTRALWPAFTAALGDPALAADPDPLDRYTERTLAAAFPDARIYYGHRRYDGGFLPLQQLAAATGLGAIAPNHLVIHPVYGPWLALRAIVVLAGDPPPPRLPIAQPCQCHAGCTTAFARAQQTMTAADWLAVRDRCALRAWRYSDDQLAFHYGHLTKTLAVTADDDRKPPG